MKKKGANAWLVTWEWEGNHAKRKQKIVAILNPRLGDGRIRDYVELIYSVLESHPLDQLQYARNSKNNPYPAQFEIIDGIPWGGSIICGHNPWLHARKVRDLRANNGTVAWEERTEEKEKVRKLAQKMQYPHSG